MLKTLLLYSLFLSFPCLPLIGNYRIKEDPLIPVEKITILGNRVTKEEIILRELTFSEGELFSGEMLQEEMKKSRENLLNTSLFNFVNISREFTSQGSTIFIVVTERWYIWPVLLFEHADRNLPAWINNPELERLNYGLQLNWNNFRGRREEVQLKARFGYKEQFSIYYFKPNLDKEQKHGMAFRVDRFRQHEIVYSAADDSPEYIRNDSAYLLESFHTLLAYYHRPGLYFSQQFYMEYTGINFNDPGFSEEYLGITSGRRQELFTFGWSGEYDIRDSWVYPLKGYMINLRLSRMAGRSSSFSKNYLSLLASYNKPLVPRLYAGTAFKMRLTRNEKMPVYFRSALGYNNYLRGFEYYIIDGNSYLISLNQIKYAIIPNINHTIRWIPFHQFNKIHFSLYGGGFFDFGFVDGRAYRRSDNNLNNKLLYSTGLGLDFVSYYDKVLRLEFTLNSLKETGIFLHLEMPFSRW